MSVLNTELPNPIYGADYNPEQWPEEIWKDDIRLMQEAGVNLVNLAIFSWAKINPAPDKFDFGWLDKTMDLLEAGGIKVNLATATASPPAWLGVKYPEIRPCDRDGIFYHHGGRQAYTPNSDVFVEHALKLIEAIAMRYKNHPALVLWHVNNEYFGNGPMSFSEVDAEAFRSWLKKKYTTLDALNSAWSTAFWSQWYYDWEEIEPPRKLSTGPNPGQRLDYNRFFSDAYVELYRKEAEVLRKIAPGIPVATNFCEPYFTPLNQFKMAEISDFAAMDVYPDPADDSTPAMSADIARSLKQGKPWILMEQVTSQTNWRPVNKLKRPGIMRLWSYSHIARGSEGVMFFQWRQSRGGSEKFHGAMVPIVGTENSRVWREVCQLGKELPKLKPILGSKVETKTGILMDWDNIWALESPEKPMKFDYFPELSPLHKALCNMQVNCNFVHPKDKDLNAFQFLIVPYMYLLRKEHADRLIEFVEGGGTLLMTCFSSLVDSADRLYQDEGYPAHLKELFGFRVEEWDALPEDHSNEVLLQNGEKITCNKIYEIGQATDAEVIGKYQSDFYAGSPALTKKANGNGYAYYLATRPASVQDWQALLNHIIPSNLQDTSIKAPEGVEVIIRRNADGERFLFLLNHLNSESSIGLESLKGLELLSNQPVSESIQLPPNEVAIIHLSTNQD